jgi:hypothetical protein
MYASTIVEIEPKKMMVEFRGWSKQLAQAEHVFNETHFTNIQSGKLQKALLHDAYEQNPFCTNLIV